MNTISLSESRGYRFLHFGSSWIQGGMLISRPDYLALDYSRQMMAWLLLPPFAGYLPGLLASSGEKTTLPQETASAALPLSILQLGLGTGSLAKFCLRYLPSAQVDAVDISAEVAQVAHTFFALPRQHPRLRLHIDDAWQWLQGQGAKEKAAVIQVDLYDAAALAPVHGHSGFYQSVADCLHPEGWLVVNLFGRPDSAEESRHRSLRENLDALRLSFRTVLWLPALKEGNVVVFCRQGMVNPDNPGQAASAALLKTKTGLDLRAWAGCFTPPLLAPPAANP